MNFSILCYQHYLSRKDMTSVHLLVKILWQTKNYWIYLRGNNFLIVMMGLNPVAECILLKALWRLLMSIKFVKLAEFLLFGLLTGLLSLIIRWVEISIKFKLLADILLRCGKLLAWIFQMLDFCGRQMKLMVVLKNIGLVSWISVEKII